MRSSGKTKTPRAFVMAGQKRVFALDVPAIYVLAFLNRGRRGCPAQGHGCPVRFEWTKRMAWILLCFERSATFETRKGTHAMRHHNSVFHSLLKHVPWHKLEQAVEKHDADALSRKLDTKRHFIALLYGQISGAASLREVVTGMASHETRLYHVGATPVKRSTMSDANSKRPWQVFSELFTQ